MTQAMYCKTGDSITFTKTVSESDVYLFAGLSGDFYDAHINEAAMVDTRFGGRIAHGALLVAFMSAAGTRMIDLMRHRGDQSVPVSLGYDRIRFVAPVRIGDTVTVCYTIETVDPESSRTVADITVTNSAQDVVAVASHVMKWISG